MHFFVYVVFRLRILPSRGFSFGEFFVPHFIVSLFFTSGIFPFGIVYLFFVDAVFRSNIYSSCCFFVSSFLRPTLFSFILSSVHAVFHTCIFRLGFRSVRAPPPPPVFLE